MLRIISRMFAILAGVFVLFSQSPSSPQAPSCNEAVTTWIKAHGRQVSQMTRAQLLRLPPEYHRSVFSAMPPRGKLSAWQNKIEEVLQKPWSSEQRTAIQGFRDAMNERWFLEGNENLAATFVTQWAAEHKNILSHLRVLEIAGTLESTFYLEFTASIALDQPGPTSARYKNPECSCNLNADFCNGLIAIGDVAHCQAGACVYPSAHGCGWVWTQTCGGACVTNIGSGQGLDGR